VTPVTERVFIQGAGRAGRGLARALRASGVDVVGVHGRRSPGGPDGVTVGPLPASLADSRTVLVTVRDAQLDAALRELAAAEHLRRDAVVLHASGSAEPAALTALRAAGHSCGTFHPLLALADPERAAAALRGAWIGIDGDDLARARAVALADLLGARTLVIPPGAKPRYHAAAVLASNFPAVLMSLAERLLVTIGLPAAVGRQALRPLLAAAAENLQQRSGAEALTGPIVRGDVATVRAHLEALRDEREVLDVYVALSRAALALAREAGTDAGALSEIGRLLENEDGRGEAG
jgi:predicted short-subunit dehydrogenase-like oxidoreductase (DUF2520 family)